MALAELIDLILRLAKDSLFRLLCQPSFLNKDVFAIDWSWRRIDFVVDFL
jgi:hypothetical protein